MKIVKNKGSRQFKASALFSQPTNGRSDEQMMDNRQRWYGVKSRPEQKMPEGMVKMPRFLTTG